MNKAAGQRWWKLQSGDCLLSGAGRVLKEQGCKFAEFMLAKVLTSVS